MKRKLPQWLLDATNSTDKSAKTNSPNSDRNSNKPQSTEQHSNISNDLQTEQTVSNGSISIDSLANLLSPSHSGIRVNQTHTSNDREALEVELRPTVPTIIKQENDIDSTGPNNTSTVTNNQQVVVKQEIKEEPVDVATSNATTITNIGSEDRRCETGASLLRNPDYLAELAHPGDVDYRRPNFPNAPIGAPACPWSASCYRRNSQHFKQLSHPPASKSTVDDDNDSDVTENDYDLDDPFINDESSDEYVPEADESDDDDPEDTQELTED